MPIRLFTHYTLALLVLLASCLASLHQSEHIGVPAPTTPSFSSLYDAAHGHQHGSEHSHNEAHNHAQASLYAALCEQLCEQCLVFGQLAAPAASALHLSNTLALKPLRLTRAQQFHTRPPTAFRSRAPPHFASA